MKPDVTQQQLDQLDSVLNLFQQISSRCERNDLSNLTLSDANFLISNSLSAIDRISGKGSTYSMHAESMMAKSLPLFDVFFHLICNS